MLTYTVTVAQDRLPTVTIAGADAVVTEGAALSFVVTLDDVAAHARTVGVAVSEDGSMLASGVGTSVTFEPGSTVAALSLATEDDRLVEPDSTVTVALEPGVGYHVGDVSSATVLVTNDDEARYAAIFRPDRIQEGTQARLGIWISNDVSHTAPQEQELVVTGDVSLADYELEASSLTLPVGSRSLRTTLTALADGEAREAPETATVTVLVDGAAVASATVTLLDPLPVIVGVAQPGGSLEAVLDSASGRVLSYAWLRDGAEIAGATGAVYEPAAVDVGAMLSVRVTDAGWSAVSAAVGPVWAEPSNPPLVRGQEELLGTELTAGSSDAYRVRLGGYGRFSASSFGSLEQEAFESGGEERELRGAFLNETGWFTLSLSPDLSDSEALVVYWNHHRIDSFSASRSVEGPVWTTRTPQPRAEYLRYVDGSSDGVHVALSIRLERPPSADASLSGLVLSDVDIGDFDGDTTSYSGTASAELESTTVAATPSDPNASVEIVDAAGSTLGTERTSRLSTGVNEIVVTVTAEDGVAERTYSVAVTRSVVWGSRLPGRDIDLGGSGEATGVWSDGTTLWAHRDWESGSVRAWDLATGSRQGSLDMRPSRREVLRVVVVGRRDAVGGELHVRRGARVPPVGPVASRRREPRRCVVGGGQRRADRGCGRPGAALYVVDNTDGRVYAYGADGTRMRELRPGSADRRRADRLPLVDVVRRGDRADVVDSTRLAARVSPVGRCASAGVRRRRGRFGERRSAGLVVRRRDAVGDGRYGPEAVRVRGAGSAAGVVVGFGPARGEPRHGGAVG